MSPANLNSAPHAGGAVYSIYQDDPDFQELLAEFTAAAAGRSQSLQESFAAGEVASIRVQAHQLKGAGGGYGFAELSELAGRLEDACKDPVPSLDRIGPMLNLVVDYLSRVRI